MPIFEDMAEEQLKAEQLIDLSRAGVRGRLATSFLSLRLFNFDFPFIFGHF
jgi:hypothetical protein